MKAKEVKNKEIQTAAPANIVTADEGSHFPPSGVTKGSLSPSSSLRSNAKFLSNKIIMIAGKIEQARYYQDLMYIEFKNPYCRLHFSEGAEYLVDISLTCLLANIPDKTFFRCNRTEVINLYYYGGYNKELNEIMLEDNSKFKLSSRNIAIFKKKIEYL